MKDIIELLKRIWFVVFIGLVIVAFFLIMKFS
jgi:hypothetical protein